MPTLIHRFADLLVAGLIFIILAVLTAPIVGRFREAAHKMQCADNLRSVAIAAHKFHEDYNRLPPGWLGPNPDGADASQSPQAGVLVHLLPYLKNDELYKRLRYQKEVTARTNPPTDPHSNDPYDPPSNVPWWQQSSLDGVANLELARVPIPEFLCPSDSPYSSTEGTIVGVHLYGSRVPQDFLKSSILTHAEHPAARELGRTNYLGVAGCVGWGSQPEAVPRTKLHDFLGTPAKDDLDTSLGNYVGVFTNRSLNTLGQITVQDGTSNTLMFGESCGGNAGPDRQGREYAFSWFAGVLPTYHGLPWGKDVPWYSFSSRHRHTVQFAFADCSTRGLRRGQSAIPGTEDWQVLQQLAGRKDGENWVFEDD